MPFWSFRDAKEPDEVELAIEGEILMDNDMWAELFGIEGTSPSGFKSELSKHKGKNVTVWINSYGGDVFAASRIYTALMEHKGSVKVKIDGVAFSAASVIAMAGTEVLMSPTSLMMVHNPLTQLYGESDELRHAADILDEVKESIMNAYQVKTGHQRAYISKLMDEETFMSARKAVKDKFADAMLYVEKTEPEPEADNAFSFSRLAIVNSASESIKRFMAEYATREKEKQPVEEPRQVPVDQYDRLLTFLNRRKEL